MATPPYQASGSDLAFWLLFGAFAVGEYGIRIRSAFRKTGNRVERWTFVIVIIGVVGGLVGGLQLAQWSGGDIADGQWPLFFVGLGLMAFGIAVRWWALASLATDRRGPGRRLSGDDPGHTSARRTRPR